MDRLLDLKHKISVDLKASLFIIYKQKKYFCFNSIQGFHKVHDRSTVIKIVLMKDQIWVNRKNYNKNYCDYN